MHTFTLAVRFMSARHVWWFPHWWVEWMTNGVGNGH